MSWLVLIIVLLTGLSFAVATEFAERARLRRLLARPCAGIRWHRRFPVAPHDDIRAFLRVFTDAFAIEGIHCTKFAPDDRPLAIYLSRYVPHLTLDDHGEFESWGKALEREYGIDLMTVWREGDVTLGELFAVTRGSRDRTARERGD